MEDVRKAVDDNQYLPVFILKDCTHTSLLLLLISYKNRIGALFNCQSDILNLTLLYQPLEFNNTKSKASE